MHKKRRYFICFTGIDGSGKTTQAKILSKSLKALFPKVVYKWCRGTPFLLKPFIQMWKDKRRVSCDQREDDKIKLLHRPLIKWVWLATIVAEYGAQVFFKIRLRQIIGRGILIADRYFYDTLVDQAGNFNFTNQDIARILKNRFLRTVFPYPDLVIYLDCPAETAFLRKREELSVGILDKKRRVFLDICQQEDWIKIDGSLDMDEVKNKIEDIVREKLDVSCEKK